MPGEGKHGWPAGQGEPTKVFGMRADKLPHKGFMWSSLLITESIKTGPFLYLLGSCFMSYLNTHKTTVVSILPCIREGRSVKTLTLGWRGVA
jgi:hypothetical protein